MLVEKWSQTVRAVGYGKASKPTSSSIMAVELCISDKNKPLLLANSTFIPYVVDALLLVRPSSHTPLNRPQASTRLLLWPIAYI